MGSARNLLVLLLKRTRNGVASAVPSQEPAIERLEVAHCSVSNHEICCFTSTCQTAVGMFKVKLCVCSVLAKHNQKGKIRMFIFFLE